MSRTLIAFTIFLGGLTSTLTAGTERQPAEAPPAISVGRKAPDFSLTDEKGKIRTLKEFRGKKNVILAFYPKDFTSG